MKRYVILLLVILFCESNSQNQNKFELTLSFERNERSKDSNIDLYSIFVEGEKVMYKYSHSGYPDSSSINLEYNLSEKSFQNLLKFIDTSDCTKNIKEINYNENLGVSINLKLKLLYKYSISQIEIRGMINDWESKEETNIKNQNVIIQVERIIESLKSKIEYFE